MLDIPHKTPVFFLAHTATRDSFFAPSDRTAADVTASTTGNRRGGWAHAGRFSCACWGMHVWVVVVGIGGMRRVIEGLSNSSVVGVVATNSAVGSSSCCSISTCTLRIPPNRHPRGVWFPSYRRDGSMVMIGCPGCHPVVSIH